MSTSEYRAAALEAIRSLVGGVTHLRDNRFVGPVSGRLWGPLPALTLAALVVASTLLAIVLPPLTQLSGLIPPLMALQFLPDGVRDMFWSAPAGFGFVVAWRIRRLRGDGSQQWQVVTDTDRLRLFEAAALPVVAAAVVLSFAVDLAPRWIPTPAWVAIELPMSLGGHVLVLTRIFMVIALVASILSTHQRLSTAIGKLFAAAFFVFGMSMAIGYSAPFVGRWWQYLPIPYLQNLGSGGSPWLLQSLFHIGLAAAAWVVAREKARASFFFPPEPPPGADNNP
jgi:hypothetical protein